MKKKSKFLIMFLAGFLGAQLLSGCAVFKKKEKCDCPTWNKSGKH